MPKGAAAFQQHQQKVEERRAQAQSFIPGSSLFKLESMEMARVRFLEQGEDMTYASIHRVKLRANSQYPDDVLCLDQEDDGTPCPFCQSTDKDIKGRSTKGYLNIIWRGGPEMQQVNSEIQAQNAQNPTAPQNLIYKLAPVYQTDEKGFVQRDQNTKKPIQIGYGDGVFLWTCSKTVYELALEKDQRFKGLMSRDFVVMRKGSTMQDTTYYIEPYNVDGGPEPMMVADMALAAEKHDVDKLTTPMSYEDASNLLNGTAAMATGGTFERTIPVPAGQDAFGGGPPVRSSAFTRPPGQ